MSRPCLAWIIAALLSLSATTAAQAATFTVNSPTDVSDAAPGNGQCAIPITGSCTLRAAIQEANALPGVDSVAVPRGTYQTASTLTVTSTINIDGLAGARGTIVDGATSARVLTVSGGGSMTFSGLTITGGAGGVYIDGNADLTLDRVAVRDNAIVTGGLAEGGGVFLMSGALTLLRSTISGNRVESTGSSGIGGGISTASATTLQIVNSTISGNQAHGPSSFGGGVSVRSSTPAVIRHSTITGNSATGSGQGGNVYWQGPPQSLRITDSVIADGTSPNGANCGGTVPTATGRNLDSGTTCAFGAGHLNSTPARLQPLGDYGGPTDTRPPLTTSATRDAASACEAAGGDQRGAPAPAGPACDIGAAELGADLATLLTASRGSAPAGSDVTYYARVKNLGSDLAPSTTLDFAVPAGAELVSIETSQGTCAATTCALGSLASGADALVAMVLRAPAPGPFTVGASSGSGIPDPAGANNAATVSTEVVPAPAPGTSTQTITVTVPTSIAPTTVAADTAPPVLGSVKLVGNARRGKTIRLRGSLSESAKVTMTVYRLTTGRRVGSACRSRRKTGRTCTITTRRGAVTVSAKAGKAVTFTLPAEIAKKTLPTGRYRVTLVAKDAAGNASRARTRTVTVKR